MPTPSNGLIPALGLLLLVCLGGAVRPAIEPGCYEGRVDPSRPIGNLHGIAMNVSWGASEGRKPVTSMQFLVEETQPTFEVVDVGRIAWAATDCLSCKQLELGPGEISEVGQCYRPIRWSREAAQALHHLYDGLTVNLTPETFSWPIRLSSVPSGQWYISLDQFTGFPGHSVLRHAVLMEKKYALPRVFPPAADRPKIGVATSPTVNTPVGDPSPTNLARAGELPLGCFLNLNVVGRLTHVYLALRSDTLGSPILSNLTISAKPSSDAAKDTPQANVMAIWDMPLRRAPGYNGYVLAGSNNSTIQAKIDGAVSAFGRKVGIDNLTLASMVLKRLRRRGQVLELQLGREGANSSRVLLGYVYPIGYNPREVMPSCCGWGSRSPHDGQSTA
ncbi:hypothetical protein FOZ63_013272 [Perkinsus olseni]|uniref:Uncharacterized protein n=1 Tax=Perkinsus olseni TaxID=32597 RepID=A0A7J6PTK8_PEROL|nr:hypothetical protein FOZ62_007472 [Perkinsus olseni]KAF4752415.1 hypothetical protein FOZ63_013272 [Perkinsus olseni]